MPARRRFCISAIYCAIFASFFFFISASLVFAVFSFKIEDAKPTSVLSKTQEIEVLLTISDLPSESYFRVAWQEGESGSYFGYVKDNGGNWVKIKPLSSEECSSYYKVSQTGDSQVTLITKIGEDTELSSGTYLLRAHRFTSTCESYKASDNSFEISVSLPTPTSIPSPSPTPTPTSTSPISPTPTITPTSAPTKATYKINEVKDEEGNTLSSVKIYVDGVYIHHYAPETLSFCNGCKCDTYVDCGFGEHTIRLEKSDYQDWSKKVTISAGDSIEVNPVMTKSSSTSTPPAPTSSPTPTPKPTSVSFTSSTQPFPTTRLGDLLESESATESSIGTIAGEVAQSGERILATATPSSRLKKVLGGIFLFLGGLAILGAGIFPFIKRQILIKKDR